MEGYKKLFMSLCREGYSDINKKGLAKLVYMISDPHTEGELQGLINSIGLVLKRRDISSRMLCLKILDALFTQSGSFRRDLLNSDLSILFQGLIDGPIDAKLMEQTYKILTTWTNTLHYKNRQLISHKNYFRKQYNLLATVDDKRSNDCKGRRIKITENILEKLPGFQMELVKEMNLYDRLIEHAMPRIVHWNNNTDRHLINSSDVNSSLNVYNSGLMSKDYKLVITIDKDDIGFRNMSPEQIDEIYMSYDRIKHMEKSVSQWLEKIPRFIKENSITLSPHLKEGIMRLKDLNHRIATINRQMGFFAKAFKRKEDNDLTQIEMIPLEILELSNDEEDLNTKIELVDTNEYSPSETNSSITNSTSPIMPSTYELADKLSIHENSTENNVNTNIAIMSNMETNYDTLTNSKINLNFENDGDLDPVPISNIIHEKDIDSLGLANSHNDPMEDINPFADYVEGDITLTESIQDINLEAQKKLIYGENLDNHVERFRLASVLPPTHEYGESDRHLNKPSNFKINYVDKTPLIDFDVGLNNKVMSFEDKLVSKCNVDFKKTNYTKTKDSKKRPSILKQLRRKPPKRTNNTRAI